MGMSLPTALGAKFMSALLTFILGGAIVQTVAGRLRPYSKAILVCQGFGFWSMIRAMFERVRAPGMARQIFGRERWQVLVARRWISGTAGSGWMAVWCPGRKPRSMC